VKACFVVSIGGWGDIYWYKGLGWRLCLGWVAFTFLPIDGDALFDMAAKWAESQEVK